MVSISRRARFVAEDFGTDEHPLCHLGSRPPRKRHQEDTSWIGIGDDELGDTMGERIGFARPGAGDDQQRPADPAIGKADAMDDRRALPLIQFFQMRCSHAVPPLSLSE